MKTKLTILKTSLIALFLIISGNVFSATYYVCTGATLSLAPDITAPSGTHYLWDVQQAGTSIAGYPSTTAPNSLPAAGTYTVLLNTVLDAAGSAGICPPDVVSNIVIALPALGISLGTPSNPTYCAANNAIKSSLINSTVTNFPAAYSTDLTTDYSYSVVKDSDPAVDGLTLGTIDGSGNYTLTTTTPGVYKITGTVKYKAKAGAAGTLLGTTGCPTSSTGSVQTVTVLAKPTAPVITFSAN